MLATEQHAKIFEAYLNRVSLADLREIVNGIERCWHEQLNGNAGSQMRVQNNLTATVTQAVARCLSSDLVNVETITCRQYGS
jgi:hypothetical protein